MKWTRPRPPFPANGEVRSAFLRGDSLAALAASVASADPATLVFAGWMITEGLGLPRHPQSDGKELYARAAALGYHDAYFWLGDYFERVGDYAASKEQYLKAAKLGNIPAHFRLGIMCTRAGPDIIAEQECVDWLWRASAKGHAHADSRLAHLAFRGLLPVSRLRGVLLGARGIFRVIRSILLAPAAQRPGVGESHPCLRL